MATDPKNKEKKKEKAKTEKAACSKEEKNLALQVRKKHVVLPKSRS
ncbi:hypothetical protein H9X57_03725 [Flavobacterium piscinae]|nr:hypothetical protein [Flavobacterium piscinae]MBC8882814.1 hypothetical protein [Flavobacterium piscinae]